MTSCPDLYQEGSYMKISKQYFNYFIRMRSTFFSMFIFRTFCTLPFLERHDINEFGRQFVAPSMAGVGFEPHKLPSGHVVQY